LTELGERLPRAANVHMAGEENDGEVTFLRTVEEGPANRSYGIYVAELAGVPEPVTRRAREVLELLQQEKAIDVRSGSKETEQVVFDLGSGQFQTDGDSETTAEAASDGGGLDPETEAVLDELRGTDVNDTSPLELMSRVQEWQQRLDRK
jgi:DNA mismatch repair protein MutS